MTDPPKSLRQMADETRQEEAKQGIGLACPNCGCRDLRVIKTRHNIEGSETSRRRVCRHCGTRVTTMEMML